MAKTGRRFVALDLNFYDEWGLNVSKDAVIVWVLALCTARRMESGGILSIAQARRTGPSDLSSDQYDSALKELHNARNAPLSLGHDPETQEPILLLHGWQEWNDPYGAKQSAKIGNHLRWHERTGRPNPECEFCNPHQQAFIASDVASDSLRVEENRLEERESDETVARPPKKQSEATPAPDQFVITSRLRKWASSLDLEGIDLDLETTKMLKWHRNNNSLCKDWNRTWQSWVRKAVEYRDERRARGIVPPQPPVVAKGAGDMFDNEEDRKAFYDSVSLGKVNLPA